MKIKSYTHIIAIISAIIFALSPVSVFALSDSLLDFYNSNDIFYYDPDGSSTDCEIPSGSYDGVASAGLSPLQAAFVDKNYPIALKLGKEYGIPWETVVAQGIVESTSGTSPFAVERNNFFGIGAYDTNPDHAHYYSSYSAGWRGYFENIRKTSVYRANGAFNYPNDPYGYLAAIKKSGYATDPKYIPVVSAVIKAVENRAKSKNWQLSKDNTTTTNNESLNSSETNSPTNTSTTPFDPYCSSALEDESTDPRVLENLKNINNMAINLSHNQSSDFFTQPKSAYQRALISTGVNRLGDECSMRGQSCDAFVATVLRSTGMDPDIPCCGANNMLNYFLSHPEKYRQIPNIGNTSNLEPGDIRSKPSHVEIIVRLPGQSSLRIASASHCERTADIGSSYYPDFAYKIFRRI
jgi:hypothetical protein